MLHNRNIKILGASSWIPLRRRFRFPELATVVVVSAMIWAPPHFWIKRLMRNPIIDGLNKACMSGREPRNQTWDAPIDEGQYKAAIEACASRANKASGNLWFWYDIGFTLSIVLLVVLSFCVYIAWRISSAELSTAPAWYKGLIAFSTVLWALVVCAMFVLYGFTEANLATGTSAFSFVVI